MSVRREITVTRKGLIRPIDIVQGTALIPFEFVVTDFTIPLGAAVVAYNKTGGGTTRKQLCDVVDNAITFTPDPALFDEGKNVLQLRVTYEEKNLFSFEIIVNSSKAPETDDAEEVESQPTLVTQLLTEMPTHDLQGNIVTFESYDDAEEHEAILDVETISSGSKLKDILSKITKFCNNIRYLFEFIGVLSIQEQGYLGVADAIAKIGSKRLIENGTTNIWDWEKYADGSCKLRGYTTINVATDSLTSWGGDFYQGGKMEVALPFPVYYASANAETNYLWSFAVCSMARDVTNASAKVVQFNIVQPTSNAIATEVIITIPTKR